MGMAVEDIIQGLKETNMICNSVFAYDRKKYIDGAIDKLCKYQMMQADYEARLRADMVAMLSEILLEFEELEPEYDCNSYSCGIADCYRTIQEKITSLKEAT